MEKIMVQGRCFVDEFGRERIFNGVNLVYKNDDDPDTGRRPVRSYIPTWPLTKSKHWHDAASISYDSA